MKKQILSKLLVQFWLIVLSIGILSSCYRPTNGCLNPSATNFDVTVDDACEDDCCTFPDLILQFVHTRQTVFSRTSISRDDVLRDDFGNDFIINEFKFFIQDIKFIGDNQTLEVMETIELTQNGIPATLKNDFSLINFGQNRYVLGSFNQLDTYHTLSFQIGLDIAAIDFSNLDADNVLSENQEDLYIDERFASFQTEIVRDTMTKDTIELTRLDQLYDIELNGSFETFLAEDLSETVIIDYTNWFKGIDMANDSEELILDKLSNNTILSFSLK